MIDQVVRNLRRPPSRPQPVDLDETRGQLAQVDEVEAGIADLVSSTVGAPPTEELPEYVQHDEEVNRIGQITAEAIVKDYEATAKNFELLAEETGRVARQCEEYMFELKNMCDFATKTAEQVRARGAEIFRRVEESAKVTAGVREEIDGLMTRISRVPLVVEDK